MKPRIVVAGTLLLGIALMVFAACQDKTPTSQSPSKNLEIVGTVAHIGDAIIIMTDTEDFAVASQPVSQRLEEMVGKRIKVSATLVEGSGSDGTPTIDVIEFSEIEQ